ncbi:hypothetical protein HY417_00420 [Candidatus Kaiserbacteria bacterium]|nr:hypothetical protein [Candidatus Kaiserbacteria bacterium]
MGDEDNIRKFSTGRVAQTLEQIAAAKRAEREESDPTFQIRHARQIIEAHSSTLSGTEIPAWKRKGKEDPSAAALQSAREKFAPLALGELGALLIEARNKLPDAPKEIELVALARAYEEKYREQTIAEGEDGLDIPPYRPGRREDQETSE